MGAVLKPDPDQGRGGQVWGAAVQGCDNKGGDQRFLTLGTERCFAKKSG